MLLNEVFQPKKLTEWPLPGRAPVVGKPVRNDDGTMTVSVGKRNYLLRPIETDFGRPTMKPVEQWEVISPSGKQIAVYPSAYSAYAWIRLVAKANKLKEAAGDDVDHDESHHDALMRTGFWGKQGAGCIILAEDTGRFLIAHRSMHVQEPGTWGTWGGAIDGSEDPADAALREVHEEAGYHGPARIEPLFVFRSGTFSYHNFLVIVPSEFRPHLNWETQGYEWCSFGDWPQPLHPGLKALLADPHSIETMRREAEQGAETEMDTDSRATEKGRQRYALYWIRSDGEGDYEMGEYPSYTAANAAIPAAKAELLAMIGNEPAHREEIAAGSWDIVEVSRDDD